MKRFDGKVVLVTGAAAGIGRAAAGRFVREGASVLGVDRDEGGLESARREFGKSFSAMVADVADPRRDHDYVQRCLDLHGQVDVAFLNAGIEGRVAPIHALELEEFDRVMAVNVRGVWIGLSRLLAVMRRRNQGVITITSSTGGLRGSGGLAPYATSKHALVGMMKSAAIEAANYGVRVNAIHPGPTQTRMLDAIVGAKPTDAVRPTAPSGRPAGLSRVAQPDQLAAAVTFLSSDEASFCTGASYLVDGGLLAGAPYVE